MAAERIIETRDVVSPGTGITYQMTTVCIEDACRKCSGDGTYRYSTFADLRKYVTELRAWENDGESDTEPPDQERNGSTECDRCGGTGHFKGDGGRFDIRMTYNGSTILPQWTHS